MLPSLARLAPTGAQPSSDKFKATVRFIRGNPDRMALAIDSEGDVSDEDTEIMTRWVVDGFGIRDRFPDFEATFDNQWTQTTDTEFRAGIKKLMCSEIHRATTFGINGRYHIERNELVLTDTSGATTWTFVVAITPRGW